MKDKEEEEKRAADRGWWVDETFLRRLGSPSICLPCHLRKATPAVLQLVS